MSRDRIPGLLGMIGGLLGLALSFAFASTGWGEPGTAAYSTYEQLNRITGVALLLMAGGWLGLARVTPKGYGRVAAWVAFIASIAMVIGTAAEFWLFTDLPYGDPTNARSLSWSAYSFGSLVQVIGATVLGIYAWRTNIWPKFSAFVLVMAVPIAVFTFVFLSPFFGPSVLAMIAGWLAWSSRGSRVVVGKTESDRV